MVLATILAARKHDSNRRHPFRCDLPGHIIGMSIVNHTGYFRQRESRFSFHSSSLCCAGLCSFQRSRSRPYYFICHDLLPHGAARRLEVVPGNSRVPDCRRSFPRRVPSMLTAGHPSDDSRVNCTFGYTCATCSILRLRMGLLPRPAAARAIAHMSPLRCCPCAAHTCRGRTLWPSRHLGHIDPTFVRVRPRVA